MKRKIFISLLLLIFNCILLCGQGKIHYKEMEQDFNYLVKTIEETHPDPYTIFGGKMAFHKKVHDIRNNLPKEGISIFEFYLLLSEFISMLNDGHTFISNPEQQEPSKKLLPVRLFFYSDALYIRDAKNEYKEYLGSKVTHVNKVPIEVLLERIPSITPCENISGAYVGLRNVLQNCSQMKRLFPEIDSTITLTLLLPEMKPGEINLTYLIHEKMEYQSWVNFPWWGKAPSKSLPFYYNFIDDEKKVVYFMMLSVIAREAFELMKKYDMDVNPSLNRIYNSYLHGIPIPEDVNEAIQKVPSLTEDFKEMLEEMKINGSTHLIIDLRFNDGGWTPIVIPTLYLLFGDQYFAFDCKAEMNKLISKQYLEKYNTTIDEYNKSNNSSLKVGDYKFGYFMRQDPSLSPEKRREKYLSDLKQGNLNWHKDLQDLKGQPIHSPKIIVVTSPSTFSAAFHYMFLLDEIGDATVVGASPSQAGNSFMECTYFELPNSLLSFSVSNSAQFFYPDDRQKGVLFKPDVPFKWQNAKKYGFNYQSEIMFIYDLIKEGKL